MDLLKTILLYLTMVFVSSVQSAPEPSILPETGGAFARKNSRHRHIYTCADANRDTGAHA